MKWERGRRSNNIEDERGQAPKRLSGGKLSLGGIALVVVFGLITKQDPLQILGQVLGQLDTGGGSTPVQPNKIDHSRDEFVSSILGDTEDTWNTLFQQIGKRYETPKLVLFAGGTESGCGYASSAVGPFYCPANEKVYLDTSFFNEMKQRFSVAGDFAQAYVIAHEVGHHVQHQLGSDQLVAQAQRRGIPREGANGTSVRLELQADCLAGVWAHYSQSRHQWLDAADIESGMKAANAIGDDTLQRQSRGRVMPDAFTHGTAEQRVRWLKKGLDSGQMAQCDTFSATTL